MVMIRSTIVELASVINLSNATLADINAEPHASPNTNRKSSLIAEKRGGFGRSEDFGGFVLSLACCWALMIKLGLSCARLITEAVLQIMIRLMTMPTFPTKFNMADYSSITIWRQGGKADLSLLQRFNLYYATRRGFQSRWQCLPGALRWRIAY